MAWTYEDMVLSMIEKDLDQKADELGVKYKLTYDPASDDVHCKIENCEASGDFSNYVREYIVGGGKHSSVSFSFPLNL